MTQLNLTMFRACDIRTRTEFLTDELAVRLARAEAKYFRRDLGVSGVLLAHDARLTGPHYLELASHEFRRAGLHVTVMPGVSSTSMFYFAAMKHPKLAGIMYGASHNPANDTGQKILGPSVRPIAEHIGPEGGLNRIKELYTEEVDAPEELRSGRITFYDPTEEYIQYSMHLAGIGPGDLRGLKIVHDYLNGAAGREMMFAFERAGAHVQPLHFTADGRFPLGAPNPVKQEVIKEGTDILKNGDYLLGIFFDGDGDRIDFYRGDGGYLSSSFVYAGILPEIQARFSGKQIGVYADLKCNPLALIELAKSGVTPCTIRNGHSQIKQTMYENQSMIGAVEESAHFYEAFQYSGARYCTENSLYFSLLVARMWHDDPTRFDELWGIQESTGREREWGQRFPSAQQRADALQAVESYFVQEGAQAMHSMPNGADMEATLLRLGAPLQIDAGSELGPNWLQICQRVSQSEDGLARWEVASATVDRAKKAKEDIQIIVQNFGAGDEYVG